MLIEDSRTFYLELRAKYGAEKAFKEIQAMETAWVNRKKRTRRHPVES